MYASTVVSVTTADGKTHEIDSAVARVEVTPVDKGSIYDPNANIPLCNWDEDQGKWVYPHGGTSNPQ